MRALLSLCFIFLVLVSTIFTSSEYSVLAQEIDEPVVTYSEPRVISGDSERCQIISVSNNNQLAINLPNANVASQDSKQASLKCRVELDVTMQLKKGWYFHSVEHTVSGTIIRSHGAKAIIAIRSTFQKKPVLQFRETRADALVARSNSIPVSFAWSKKKQCSGTMQSVIGKVLLNLDARTQGDAQASLNAFDIILIPAQCGS